MKSTEVPFSEECALYLSQGSVLFPSCLVLLTRIEGVGDKTKPITQQDSLSFRLEKTSKTTKSNPALPNPSLTMSFSVTPAKCLQGWKVSHFTGQPVPVLDNPSSRNFFLLSNLI